MTRVLAIFALLLAALPLRADVDVQQITSPAGHPIWLVEDHSVPMIALELRFRGGTALDPEGKDGATNLMVALLEEGAGTRDARAFAAAREELAAEFRYSASDDEVTVSARLLSETRDAALALLHESLTEPRFDADAVERVRAQVLAGLASDARDPNVLSWRAFRAIAFGKHPYARASDGTPESVAALSAEDLRAALGRALVAGRVSIGVSGDITAAEIGPMIDALLAGLPTDGPTLPEAITPALSATTETIDFPGPQSVVAFGQPGILRNDPDYIPAYMLMQILGGGSYDSRLTREIREDRGLTYGIYAWLAPKDHSALIGGQFASDNRKVAEAVALLRAEWDRMADAGVTETELAEVKTYLTGAFPLYFDGNRKIAGMLASFMAQGLPASYVNTRNAQIEAVTLDEINRVAQRILTPEALQIFVVGAPEGLDLE